MRWLLLLLAFAPLAVLFVWHARLYYWLCDDAYISFRYARNLLAGHGLVYNPGERVEGYTNFLWVLELAAAWRVLGVPPPVMAGVLSVLCTAGTLWLTVRLALSTPWRAARWGVVWTALLLLAVNRSFAVWTTGGLETRQFTLLVLAGVVLVRRYRDGAGAALAASLCMAAAEYTRPEGTLLFACMTGWMLLDMAYRRRFRLPVVLAFVLPFAALVAAHYGFRLWYYGDVFPNTYYAKVVRPWPEAGIRYVAAGAVEHGLVLVLPLAVIGTLARMRRRRDTTHVLGWMLILPHIAYLVRIGGDHFEFRPMDFHWPLLAVAAADGALALGRAASRLGRGRRRRTGRMVRGAVALAAALLAAAYTGLPGWGKYLATHGRETRAETLKLFVPLTPENLPAARLLPGMTRLLAAYNATMRYCVGHSVGTSHQEHKVFWLERVRDWSPYERIAGKGVLPPGLLQVDGLAGIMPYHMPDVAIIDLFGLNDRTVARMPVTKPNSQRQLAHDRMATMDYITSRGVNITISPAARTRMEALLAAEYALPLDDDLWMPFDAFTPEWVADKFAGRPVHRLRRTALLGDFEDGTAGDWSTSGTAFEGQPRGAAALPGQPAIHGAGGRFILNSWHPELGAAATGEALSPPFQPTPGDAVRFRFAAGLEPTVGAELLRDGRTVRVWRGRGNSHLRHQIHRFPEDDTSGTWRLRVFDTSKAADGFVLVDDVELVAFPTEPGLHMDAASTTAP